MFDLSLLRASWLRRAVLFGCIFGVLAATRLPVAPRYLYYFDSVNFALALEEFSPARHQPQPPGYPFFVALTRAVHLFVPEVEQVFLLTGLLAAAGAVLLLWLLGEQLFGARAGFAAAILLLFHPVLWFSGVTNQVRIFLAIGGCGVALLCWLSWERGSHPRGLYLGALALGILAGFRPTVLLYLIPLLVLTAIRSRRNWREIACAVGLLAAGLFSWLGITLVKVGGPWTYYRLLTTYASEQFQGSSVLYGATVQSGVKMALAAVVWTGFGVLAWIWALPLALYRPLPARWRSLVPFLLAWFLPPFLFHVFVHVGDPDHTLITVPVLCLAGGWVFASAGAYGFRKAWVPAVTLGVVASVALFLNPPAGPAKAGGLRAVTSMDKAVNSTFDSIRTLQEHGPVYLICHNSQVSWRQVSYYFPEEPVLVLNRDPDAALDVESTFFFLNRRHRPPDMEGGAMVVPPNANVVMLMPLSVILKSGIADRHPLLRQGPLFYFKAQPGMRMNLGHYRFASSLL